VSLDDVLGTSVHRLQAELHDARTWEARFAVLDREIASRLHTGPSLPREISWAWEQLTGTAGQAKVQGLSKKIGWGERHFARQFNHHIGMTPKVFARVLRFGQAVRQLTREGEARLADVALDCGYYDQAHFTRDFREFAGVTPTELLASRRPAESGFSAAS
jgi:AraC-like DNA-binding protein